MREIWGSITKGIIVIMLIVLLSPIALAQAGRGDLFMSGSVRDEDGSPILGEQRQYPRIAHTIFFLYCKIFRGPPDYPKRNHNGQGGKMESPVSQEGNMDC